MTVDPAFVEVLGWTATGVFVASYFTRASLLTRVQMAGALMWTAYGVLQHALPVVVANLLVFAAAGWTARRSRRQTPGAEAAAVPAEPSAG